MDIWGIVGISICLIYPHVAFLRYLKGERRETEILHMQIDMALLGVLMSLVNFTLVIALPYLIANSAGNYALRGMKQVIQGFVLTFTTGMAMVVFREQNIVIHADSIELIPPFLYLTVATHFMGYLTYVRGISLIRRKQEAEETAKLDFLTGLQNRRSMFEQNKRSPGQALSPRLDFARRSGVFL